MMTSRVRALVLLIAVFAAGVLAGAGGFLLLGGRGPRRPSRHGPDEFIRYATKTLDLTPAQQDSVLAILTRRKASMDSLWAEVGPRFETLQTSVRSDIRAQLNPDQQRKFAEMNKRFDAARATRGGSHAPR